MNLDALFASSMLQSLQQNIFTFSNFLGESGLLNILILLSTIAVFILALQGFRFLRRQETEDAQRNLTFALMQNIVRLRDRYRVLRSPLIQTTEYPPKYQNKNLASLQPEDEAEIYRHVFFRRWQRFRSEWESLYDRILLSEIYWKPWCKEEIQDLEKMINELKYHIEQFIVFKKYELTNSPSAQPEHLGKLNDFVFLQDEQEANFLRLQKNTQKILKFLQKS